MDTKLISLLVFVGGILFFFSDFSSHEAAVGSIFTICLGLAGAYGGYRWQKGHEKREEAKEELIEEVEKGKDKEALEKKFGEEYVQHFIENDTISGKDGEMSVSEEEGWSDLKILGVGLLLLLIFLILGVVLIPILMT